MRFPRHGGPIRNLLAEEAVSEKTLMSSIDGKLTVLIWAVGINAAATITMLAKHW
jgi:hypothetical protein